MLLSRVKAPNAASPQHRGRRPGSGSIRSHWRSCELLCRSKNWTWLAHDCAAKGLKMGAKVTNVRRQGSLREHPGREGPACGRHPDRDAALHRARHMAPQASSTRDSTQWGVWWGGATIGREWNMLIRLF